jgi:hypothetical protein
VKRLLERKPVCRPVQVFRVLKKKKGWGEGDLVSGRDEVDNQPQNTLNLQRIAIMTSYPTPIKIK